jgi:hypothetical protein
VRECAQNISSHLRSSHQGSVRSTCRELHMHKTALRSVSGSSLQNYDFCRNLCEREAKPSTVLNCFVASDKVAFQISIKVDQRNLWMWGSKNLH